MTLYVLDASTIGPLTVPDEAHLTSAIDPYVGMDLIAPRHWPFEVANLLLMAMRRGRIADADRVRIFEAIADLGVTLDATSEMAAWRESFDLAVAERLTLYDAAYVELAARLGCGLLTFDRRLAAAAAARGIATPLQA